MEERTRFEREMEDLGLRAEGLSEMREFESPGWLTKINRGSRDYIRWIQSSLNKILGLNLVVDGIMGQKTQNAIRSFQQKRGLVADGIVGPSTEQDLLASGAPPPPVTPGPKYAACQSRQVFVDCPPIGTPPHEVLDHFGFDKATLDRARHMPRIINFARLVISSQRSQWPVRTILIAGHTDPVGSDDYNFDLGWRRAKEIMRELCETIERMNPGLTRHIKFELTSCGERQPKSRPEESRRVEIFMPGSKKKPIPPDSSLCGVPNKSASQTEIELERELHELEQAARAQPVSPSLCLYQNHSNTSHRNHFLCQATRWARQVRAYEAATTSNCRQRVGPTPYDTGADIIRAIETVYTCLGQRRVKVVHIFSHSGDGGIFGTASGSTVGLYSGALDSGSRQAGGRTVDDIPTNRLSDNVVFVLHGCNTAFGDDNFARALFEHLSGTLQNPKVFGHFNSGCAGRDNSWREYSRRSLNGRRIKSISPHYKGSGCCG